MLGGMGVVALIFGLWALGNSQSSTYSNTWVALTVIAVLCAATAIRALFVRVQVGSGGLDVHDYTRVWRASWSEIAALAVEEVTTRSRSGASYTYYPTMVLRSGRKHRLDALASRQDSEAEASIQRLEFLAPAGAKPRYVRYFEYKDFMAQLKSGAEP